MPDAAAWQAFGGVVAVLVFLSAGYAALRRLGVLGGRSAASPETEPASPASNAERIYVLEQGLANLRLHVAENYVRRDDWVPAESRVVGLLEAHSAMLARLDERTEAMMKSSR